MKDIHFHHIHVLAPDVERTFAFYERWFDAKLIGDVVYGGARNLFVAIGAGRIHFYDRSPNGITRNPVTHLGLVVNDLDQLFVRLIANSVRLREGIQRFPDGNYLLIDGPDNVVIEAFEPNPSSTSPLIREWFGLSPTA